MDEGTIWEEETIMEYYLAAWSPDSHGVYH